MALQQDASATSAFVEADGDARCSCCGGFHTVDETATNTPFDALNADDRGETGPNGKVSLTTSEAAAQISRSNTSWSQGLGQPATVTYAFRSTAPATSPSDTEGFARFNDAQISAALGGLAGWSDVANITFQRIADADGYSNNATILFGNYTSGSSGSAAFAYLPGSTSASSASGDIWVNVSIGYNATPTLLGYGYQVLTHEIGHAIGLSHPASYNAGEGVSITYSANAVYYEDTRQYTIMSYFSETNTGGNFNTASGTRQYSAAPLLDDIAAAQRLYGANTTTRTGDTVYGFNSNAERAWFIATSAATDLIFAVWDAGGTDTLDFSGYADAQTIDLRQGAFSNVGGLVGNVAIAIGVVIENAVGGSGADTIRGNTADNRLTGGGGADTLDGGAGSDVAVYGGLRAAYTIAYSGQTIQVSGPDGSDVLTNIEFLQFTDQRIATAPTGGVTLSGDVSANVLDGTAFADSLSGLGGDDRLNGLGGADTLDGGTGSDSLQGGDGDDVLIGGFGDDRLDGGAGYDVADYASATAAVTAELALSRVTGGAGSDTLVAIEEVQGSTFDDRLIGGAGADVLRGGGGVDTLEGGDGGDRLYAGAPGQTGGAPDLVKSSATANATIAAAVSLDAGFDTVARDGVADATTIPHATVLATTHGGVEYYAFTVTAGARATFDIDTASFDSTLRLYNAAGTELASNDDNNSDGGPSTDSMLSYTFTTAGVYYLQVAEWRTNSGGTFTSGAPTANGTYTLHTSVSGHTVVAASLLGSSLNGQVGNDSLYGGDGADVLNGGTGSDLIDGGAGDDVLQLSGNASDYVLTRTASGWLVSGPDGVDTVTNVERVQFGSDAPVAIDAANAAPFDALTYIASNPDLILAFGTDTTRATAHYELVKDLELRPLNSFNALTYIASYQDLISAFGTDTTAATLHYIQSGYFEGRVTNSFNPLIYAASNPDLALAFGSNGNAASEHFITVGAMNAYAVTGFEPLLYIASNPDLATIIGNDGQAGLLHYLDAGVREGRETSTFDALVYIASYADLAQAFGVDATAGLNHYLVAGADEGRSTNFFDARLYAASNIDLAEILGGDTLAATKHYIQNGLYEGRQISGFDSVAYLLSQGDLAGRTASAALDHWLAAGADEGRDGDGGFGLEQAGHRLTGSSTAGVIDAAGDLDWFELNLSAGQTIQIDLRGAGAGAGTLTDGTLRIYDTLGRLIATDTDSGSGFDARIAFNATVEGLYYIVVSGAGSAAGTYQIATALGGSLDDSDFGYGDNPVTLVDSYPATVLTADATIFSSVTPHDAESFSGASEDVVLIQFVSGTTHWDFGIS